MRSDVRLRAAAAIALLAACGGARPVDSDAGPAAARIAGLFWLMTILGAVVFVLFCGALLYALFHRERAPRPATPEGDRRATRWIVGLGAVAPAIVLVPVLVHTMRTLGALDPFARRPDLVVEVVGKRWWWDVRYLDPEPGRVFRTANELHIPVGRRVELRLASTDVIHSFWVPQLQGKTDLIPGKETVTWIQADRPGVYAGQCAEYCGLQHTHMEILVVAQPLEEYEAWAASQRLAAAEPADSMTRLGRQAFLQSACALCHQVRGTPAGGAAGPDLTHLASRRTLAAGVVPNTAGHLGGWIANPQALKPGSLMPRVPLDRDEFRLILHYLQTLK